MKKAFIIITILALFRGVPLFAQAISLETCIKRAMESNSEVVTAAKNIDISYGSRTQSISKILPKISAGAGMSYSGDESYSYSLSASLPIFSGFRNINNIRIANESVKSAEADLDRAEAKAVYDVTSKYINLYKAQEALKIAETIAERRKVQVEIVKVKYESGREHKGSYLTSKASMLESKYNIEAAKRAIKLSSMRLASVSGMGGLEDIEAEGMPKQPEIPADKPDFGKLANLTPELRKLASQRESAALSEINARMEFVPDISASGSYGKSGDSLLPERESWRLGLSISMPLFQGFNSISQVSNAYSKKVIAEVNEKQGYTDKVIELKESWNNLLKAKEDIEVTSEYLDAVEARAEIAQAQYSAGLLSYDNWTVIENELIKYRNSRLDALTGLYLASAEWEYKKGVNPYEEK